MPKKVPPSSAFAERVTQARHAKGLTQVQLAELIGSSQRAISHYETSAEFAPGNVLVALAKALDVTSDELLGLKAPKPQLRVREDPESRRLWKTFQLVADLPERDRSAVIRLIQSLVSSKQLKQNHAKKAG